MPDVPPHTPGYCAKTVDGESDCVAGSKGALGLHHSETLSLRAATHACLRKCDACARCRYITVSPRHADCSRTAVAPSSGVAADFSAEDFAARFAEGAASDETALRFFIVVYEWKFPARWTMRRSPPNRSRL